MFADAVTVGFNFKIETYMNRQIYVSFDSWEVYLYTNRKRLTYKSLQIYTHLHLHIRIGPTYIHMLTLFFSDKLRIKRPKYLPICIIQK
jgi:hypothetical protein